MHDHGYTRRVEVLSGPDDPADMATVRRHMRVLNTVEDDLVALYFRAAMSYAERYAGISIGARVVELTERWNGGLCAVDLPLGPVDSLVSVHAVTGDDPPVALDLADFRLVKTQTHDALYPSSWTPRAWPEELTGADFIVVRYVVGYPMEGSPEAMTIPDDLLHGILMQAGDAYENREAVIVGTIMTQHPHVERILFRFRRNLGI